MDFEWDPAKADINFAKHGVDFEDAIIALCDPQRLIEIAPRSYPEVRYRVIGAAKGRILFVVYTMRGMSCRIISARRASRRERTTYSLQARP